MVTYAKYSDPLDKDAPKHKFAVNPLTYTTH